MLYFRISVPLRLRTIFKVSELTTSLHTQERKNAIPAAYKLAGEAKSLFLYLDGAMNDTDTHDYDLLAFVVKELEQEERDLIAKLPLVARRIIADKENEVAAAKRREKQAVVQVKASAFDKLHSITASAGVSHQQPNESIQQPTKKRNKSPRLSIIH